MEKAINLTLPEFAFVEGSDHESNNILKSRNVILHVRSASVIEILDVDQIIGILEGTLTYNFSYTNKFEEKEKKVAVLHYCATLDKISDAQMIKEQILKPSAMWFCNYCTWEDNNIVL